MFNKLKDKTQSQLNKDRKLIYEENETINKKIGKIRKQIEIWEL